MTIATLIATTVVKNALKKNAIRIAQRKVGLKKAASIYRRFNSKKTFVKNVRENPAKLLQLAKSFAVRKLFSTIPPIKYLSNWIRYGIKATMKRWAFKFIPTEAKGVYYFIKNCKSQFEKVELMKEGKVSFWTEMSKLSHRKQLHQIENILDFAPTAPKELQDYIRELLNYEFMFPVKSPQTDNFNARLHSYNFTTHEYKLYILGVAPPQFSYLWRNADGSWKHGTNLKYYTYQNVPVEVAKEAVRTRDFGRDIWWEHNWKEYK